MGLKWDVFPLLRSPWYLVVVDPKIQVAKWFMNT